MKCGAKRNFYIPCYALLINKTKIMYINIEKIIELGDNTERAFFRWLDENDIGWYQKGGNLKNIWVFDTEQCKQVKAQWNEVELNEA